MLVLFLQPSSPSLSYVYTRSICLWLTSSQRQGVYLNLYIEASHITLFYTSFIIQFSGLFYTFSIRIQKLKASFVRVLYCHICLPYDCQLFTFACNSWIEKTRIQWETDCVSSPSPSIYIRWAEEGQQKVHLNQLWFAKWRIKNNLVATILDPPCCCYFSDEKRLMRDIEGKCSSSTMELFQ